MSTRLRKELWLTLASILVSGAILSLMVLALRLLSAQVSLHPVVFLSSLFLVPLVCGIYFSFRFLKRDCRTTICLLILAALDLLHVILSQNNTAVTKLLSLFTGNYNLEATAFFLFYAVLFYAGLLFGIGIGSFLWRIPKQAA